LVNLSRLEKEPAMGINYLAKIELSIHRLETFVKEVLDYSRTNRKELNTEKIKLSGFVQDIINDLKYQESAESIHVMLALDQEEVETDKFLLKAIKYQKKSSGHQPFLKISSYAMKDKLKIRIEDNGEGILNEYRDKVFDMFYRGSDTSTGSGLGLYITKEAINKLNGEIELESTQGVGTTFTITLPLPAQV
jgi:signal transduction histidine kinase